ncbi:MAG: glycosyltransferase family 2 protein [Pseudomonadota bacterium]
MHRSLGTLLLERGEITPQDLFHARALQRRQDVPLWHILRARGMVTPAALQAAREAIHGTRTVPAEDLHPCPQAIAMIGPARCLKLGLLPVLDLDHKLWLATDRAEAMERTRRHLPKALADLPIVLADEDALQNVLAVHEVTTLTQQAETRVRAEESCRVWQARYPLLKITAGLLFLAALFTLAPLLSFGALVTVALITLVANIALKLAAGVIALRKQADPPPADPVPPHAVPMQLPVISILVPLFEEAEIATRLVQRLERLEYPRECLDICLIVEEDDACTRATLTKTKLPKWMRVIQVPPGAVKTKPRALNYAMDFARGSIIGVFDAEDAPAPRAMITVARAFHDRGPEVACLQGRLDFYNSRSNWMSRCFTIEYATWFGVILPGLAKLGCAIPLGGTTLFFRRTALEELGGWDAHNVTEDADLGMRLARYGYRTDLVDTVTEEEANCRPWPWVKQRSRWIKGYAATYAVHMREPRQLWQDLGARKFWGFQLLFLGSLIQAALSPVLWSFWLMLFGLWHPLSPVMPFPALIALQIVFALSGLATIAVSLIGVRSRKHRHLRGWVLTLPLYFPLATAAAYKGLWELIQKPFYWDKTDHGVFEDDAAIQPVNGQTPQLPLPKAPTPPLPLRPRPASDALQTQPRCDHEAP